MLATEMVVTFRNLLP